MKSSHVYFGGSNFGTVEVMPQTTFSDLVNEVLNFPIGLNVTQEQFHALPKKERNRVKQVPYLTPCSFKDSPSSRLLENATAITLVCLDIDDPEQARPYASNPDTLLEQLEPFNFAIYTTASSTKAEPRLRIMVEADDLPVHSYINAVKEVASRIGLVHVTKESKVTVQPMYLPTVFADSRSHHPLLAFRVDGTPITEKDLGQYDSSDFEKDENGESDGFDFDDLAYIHPIVDGLRLEDVEEALTYLDPDCSYPDWLEVAAGLRHQFYKQQECEQAYELFDKWSSKGTKYSGQDDTAAKWKSLKPNPKGRNPRTVRSILWRATEQGWDNTDTKEHCYNVTQEKLKELTSKLVGQKLLRSALKAVAATPLLTNSEEDSLLNWLVKVLRNKPHNMHVSLTSLRKDLHNQQRNDRGEKDTSVPKWCKGICYLSSPNVFSRPATQEYFSPEALDRVYGSKLMPTEDQMKEQTGSQKSANPFKPIARPQDYILNMVKCPIAYDTMYDPTRPNDIYVRHEGRHYLNTYIRTYPEPDMNRANIAGKVFLQHLVNLIDEPEYRRTLVDFMAYNVQYPGNKVRWAVLLQGVQGCGKTFLAEAMSSVLGRGHVKPVDNTSIRGNWNDWAQGAQLIVVEEVRASGQNRLEVMDKLKPLVSNDTITVNQRFRDTRVVPNRSNYMLFSNYHDALVLHDGDRRYFTLESRLQTRQQVEDLGKSYFEELFNMLRCEAAGLRAFFEQHQISENFAPNGRAPRTKYTEAMIEDSNDGAMMSVVRDLIQESENPLVQNDIVSSSALYDMLTCIDSLPTANLTANKVSSLLKDIGWTRVNRIRVGDDRHVVWVKREDRRKQDSIIKEFRYRSDTGEKLVDESFL